MKAWWLAWLVLFLVGCGSLPPEPARVAKSKRKTPVAAPALSGIQASGSGRDVVIYAMGLLDVDYQFGGSNPESGLDCSGMVSFIYRNAVGLDLPHNASRIASMGRVITKDELGAGDLVFFNTRGKSFSHVGIYMGEGRFIHAPSTNGKIRVDLLSADYYASRFEGGRSFF